MRSLSTDTLGDTTSALSRGGHESLHSSTTSSVEGLRMAQDFIHDPVLLDEVVELVSAVPSGVVVDATLGGAGHALALLLSRSDLAIVGLDRDEAARAAASQRLAGLGERSRIVNARFSEIADVIAGLRSSGDWPDVPGAQDPAPVVAIFADLGVSSPQLDRSERGFSFAKEGPLDMRMDPSRGPTAAQLLEGLDEDELVALLREHGEGRYARRIARSILAARPILTTQQLAEVVDRSVPRGDRRRGHVASRTFQALRVAVNDELDELDALLDEALELLAPGGRLIVISYHSGEDARVKHTMRAWADGGCTCPPAMPCVCGATPRGTLLSRRAVIAGEQETSENPRARSARLRAFEVSS